MQITSQKQARFFGRISRMKKNTTGRGPSPAKARMMMQENRGMRMADLPVRAPARSAKRNVSRRGGR
jgi:hypothetical protein